MRLTVIALTLSLISIVQPDNQTGYRGNPKEILFPGPVSQTSLRSSAPVVRTRALDNNTKLKKSLQLAKQLNSIENVQDYLSLVNATNSAKVIPLKVIVRAGVGGIGERSSNIISPKPAKCMPEPQVVPVKENPDPSKIYFPSCIRVNRCGGCCNHGLYSCQPSSTEIRVYQIFVTKVNEYDNEAQSTVTENVGIEEHTNCECKCRIKATDCIEKQYYDEEECRCICNNTDEEEKCDRNPIKYWNSENCRCMCHYPENCSTGFYFDENTCSCKRLSISSNWLNNERRTGYRFPQTNKPRETPPVIIPLDANDPRRRHKDDPDYK